MNWDTVVAFHEGLGLRETDSLFEEAVRPVEDQSHFGPGESETLLALIIEEGDYTEDGGETGNRDWPTL